MTESEWLLTDGQGGFAMGTRSGVRLRKYHGFYLRLTGRGSSSGLLDFEMMWDGVPFWPHLYQGLGDSPSREGPQEPVEHPLRSARWEAASRQLTRALSPLWCWSWPGGRVSFGLEALPQVGIRLFWEWRPSSRQKQAHRLSLRPFLGFRPLHGLGGVPWSMKRALGEIWGLESSDKALFLRISTDASRPGIWREQPLWYRGFFYPEERERGYEAHEDLFSAGAWEVDLDRRAQVEWIIGPDRAALGTRPDSHARAPRGALDDFRLRRPAGICAGYPWFGEWGRDTFISLPGLVLEQRYQDLKTDPEDEKTEWVSEVLNRWGAYIDSEGMLPNLLDEKGTPQWDSADATLWWIHSLAAIWLTGSAGAPIWLEVVRDQSARLDRAIEAIENGRHRFLLRNPSGLLEVTGAHATWMDARWEGGPVSGREGALPEINALWFQARCLQSLLKHQQSQSLALGRPELQQLAESALRCHEPGRPNMVFLHSIPLAPSFVYPNEERRAQDLEQIVESLWTPMGLRTLSPQSSHFRPRYQGDQRSRDLAYHQGTVWSWLAGHYEMARARVTDPKTRKRLPRCDLRQALRDSPIPGHLPEIYDACSPHLPRGAPAQAWSLACQREAELRQKLRLDRSFAPETRVAS